MQYKLEQVQDKIDAAWDINDRFKYSDLCSVSYTNKQRGEELRISGNRSQALGLTKIIRSIDVCIFAKTKESLIPLFNKLANNKYKVEWNENSGASLLFNIPSAEIQELVPALRIIKQFIPIKSIINHIHTTLQLKAIPNREEFFHTLNTLIQEDKISEAVGKALVIEEDEAVLWELIELLEKHYKFSDALEVCQLIPKENPNYPRANEKAEQFILLHETVNLLSPEEKRHYLEAKIRFMLRRNNPEEQPLLDQRFHEFAGSSTLVPAIKGVNLDEDTILEAGRIMASLRQEISILQEENKALKQKEHVRSNDLKFF